MASIPPNTAGEVNRIEMRRNLKDPIFAGYLIQVQGPLEYAIHGTRGDQIIDRSRTFHLKVLRLPCPGSKRCDHRPSHVLQTRD